jgi:hypothetical protein
MKANAADAGHWRVCCIIGLMRYCAEGALGIRQACRLRSRRQECSNLALPTRGEPTLSQVIEAVCVLAFSFPLLRLRLSMKHHAGRKLVGASGFSCSCRLHHTMEGDRLSLWQEHQNDQVPLLFIWATGFPRRRKEGPDENKEGVS